MICLALICAGSCSGNNVPAVTQDTAPSASAVTETTEAVETTEAAETAAAEKTIPADSPYVIADGITDRMKALSMLIDGNKARLAGVFKRAKAGEPITVAYFGGSITQGSTATPTTCYAYLTTEWLKKQFPESEITYVNAGIGATGSYIGVFREDRDVISQSPDLVFVDFSVNDTTEHTDRNIASYDGVLRKLWFSESKPAVVTIAMTQDNGTSFQEYHSVICRAYDIPMISYHDAIMDVIANGHIKWTDISDDNIHPNEVGHSVLTEIVTAYLESVIDGLDGIDTDNESDLSSPYSTDKYSTARIIVPGSEGVVNETGWEVHTEDSFGNFGGYWRAQSKDGTFDDVEPLKFETNARSIGILYGKLTTRGGRFDVFVNGTLVDTIDTAFRNGWGNYVEAAEIIEFKEAGIQTVEIVPKKGEKSAVVISAITITE